MGINVSDYPVITSPAACPRCGSVDVTHPWQGRRTLLWLARCKDCDTTLRSSEPFTVIERKALVYGRVDEHIPIKDSFQRLASARIAALNKIDPKLKQYSRVVGEDDCE